jgi:hypothetical protein
MKNRGARAFQRMAWRVRLGAVPIGSRNANLAIPTTRAHAAGHIIPVPAAALTW